MQEQFKRFAVLSDRYSGAPLAFIGAVMVVVVWALTGPLFRFSDTWQLIINTGTTIFTFLLMTLSRFADRLSAETAQGQTDRMESLEQTLDEHVNTTAKQHTEELRANTKLTEEIHRMVTQWMEEGRADDRTTGLQDSGPVAQHTSTKRRTA